MLVNEVRPLSVYAFDDDELTIECGVPPCICHFDTESYCDLLFYDWAIIEGGGSFIGSTGAVAIYQAPSDPTHVKVRLTVFDNGEVPEEPVEVIFEFDVYKMQFINQANTPLANLLHPPAPALNEGLKISLRVTDADMNGAGGSGAPTFDGPVGTDPSTYRLQIDKSASSSATTFSVLVQVLRAWPPDTYEVASAYQHSFTTLPPQQDVFRTPEHLRLVSNAPPREEDPGYYDAEVSAVQCLYVRPGDWVRAEVIGAGAIELPVERPWSEASTLPSQGEVPPVSLLTIPVDYFAMSGATPAAIHSGWQSGAEFCVRRLSEDWAQAAIRLTLPQSVKTDAGPYTNLLRVNLSQPNIQPGTLKVTATAQSGAQVTAEVVIDPADPNQTSQTVAEDISQQIDNHASFEAEMFMLTVVLGALKGYYIVVNKKTDVLFAIDKGTSAYKIKALVPGDVDQIDWTDSRLSTEEQIVLATNLKSGHGPDQHMIDIIVANDGVMDFEGGSQKVGRTYVTDQTTGAYEMFGGLAQTVFLTKEAGDGSDVDNPSAAGHEVGHFLLDLGPSAHVSSPPNLMIQGNQNPERPDLKKRLTDDQIRGARQGPPVHVRDMLSRECVPIPDWKH